MFFRGCLGIELKVLEGMWVSIRPEVNTEASVRNRLIAGTDGDVEGPRPPAQRLVAVVNDRDLSVPVTA